MQIRTLPGNFPSSNTFDTLLVSFLNFTGLVGLASWHLVLTFFTTDFTHRHLQDLASAPRPSLRLPFLHSCGWPFWTQKCCFCWCLISASLVFLPSFASFAYILVFAHWKLLKSVVLYDFLFRAKYHIISNNILIHKAMKPVLNSTKETKKTWENFSHLPWQQHLSYQPAVFLMKKNHFQVTQVLSSRPSRHLKGRNNGTNDKFVNLFNMFYRVLTFFYAILV